MASAGRIVRRDGAFQQFEVPAICRFSNLPVQQWDEYFNACPVYFPSVFSQCIFPCIFPVYVTSGFARWISWMGLYDSKSSFDLRKSDS